jgi:hypothetical protein
MLWQWVPAGCVWRSFSITLSPRRKEDLGTLMPRVDTAILAAAIFLTCLVVNLHRYPAVMPQPPGHPLPAKADTRPGSQTASLPAGLRSPIAGSSEEGKPQKGGSSEPSFSQTSSLGKESGPARTLQGTKESPAARASQGALAVFHSPNPIEDSAPQPSRETRSAPPTTSGPPAARSTASAGATPGLSSSGQSSTWGSLTGSRIGQAGSSEPPSALSGAASSPGATPGIPGRHGQQDPREHPGTQTPPTRHNSSSQTSGVSELPSTSLGKGPTPSQPERGKPTCDLSQGFCSLAQANGGAGGYDSGSDDRSRSLTSSEPQPRSSNSGQSPAHSSGETNPPIHLASQARTSGASGRLSLDSDGSNLIEHGSENACHSEGYPEESSLFRGPGGRTGSSATDSLSEGYVPGNPSSDHAILEGPGLGSSSIPNFGRRTPSPARPSVETVEVVPLVPVSEIYPLGTTSSASEGTSRTLSSQFRDRTTGSWPATPQDRGNREPLPLASSQNLGSPANRKTPERSSSLMLKNLRLLPPIYGEDNASDLPESPNTSRSGKVSTQPGGRENSLVGIPFYPSTGRE